MTARSLDLTQNIIEFYNRCYQSDNRDHRLWDVLSSKHDYLRLLSESQFESIQHSGVFDISYQYGAMLENVIAMYRREKSFLYTQYFVVGKLPIGGGFSKTLSKLCAPLLIYDAELTVQDERYTVSIDKSSYRWNTHLLSVLSDDNNISIKLSELIDEHGNFQLESIRQTISSSLAVDRELVIPDIDDIKQLANRYQQKQSTSVINPFWKSDQVNSSHDNPKIKSSNHLLEAKDFLYLKNKADTNTLKLMPAAGMFITNRSLSSRGIIDELNVMAKASLISAPLAQLYNKKYRSYRGNKYEIDNVPGILSDAQQHALKNAATKDLSVLIGPPGTGKSYTIACIILERFLQGESVLLVTQNEAAVDVVQEKLINHFGINSSAITRAGENHRQYQFLKRIKGILGGLVSGDIDDDIKKAMIRAKKKVVKAEKKFLKDSKKAVEEGIFIESYLQGKISDGFINQIRKWYIKRQFNNRQPLYKQLMNIHDLQQVCEDLLAKHINNSYEISLENLLANHRHELVKFDAAIRSRTSYKQHTRFLNVDYSLLLRALPIWLSPLTSLHRTLPLKRELFDLVIIDEATQCDIASCLPALHRAKRAMVVGDPKQLRHLSFLSGQKQSHILKQLNLSEIDIEVNYRDHSMIDLAQNRVSAQDAVVMLDEHYRSHPEIIRFSNNNFYDGQIRIMTEKPNCNELLPVQVFWVENGVRDKGVNTNEIKAIVTKLHQLIKQQQMLPKENRLTIGVLSFFREQAEALNSRLMDEFDSEILMAFKLKASTPYGFQGEERDIMLISCALGVDCPKGAYSYLNRPDVFNVSITRARQTQWIFTSVEPDQIPKDNLLRQYLGYVKNLSNASKNHNTERDQNISELMAILSEHGMELISNYSIAGIPMDLVVVSQGNVLVIDLIGFPGEYQDVLHLDRYKIFERADLSIFPLSFNAWIYRKTEVISQIKSQLRQIHQRSIKNISVQYRAKYWKKILKVDKSLGQQTKEIEYQLINSGLTECWDQLGQLVAVICQFDYLLKQTFDRNEISFLRYQDNISELCLVSLSIYADAVKSLKNGKDKSSFIDRVLNNNQQVIDKISDSMLHIKATFKMSGEQSRLAEALNKMEQINIRLGGSDSGP